MAFVLVRHKVADFEKWKQAFDAHGPKRKEAGSRGGFVFRNDDDKNEILVLLDFADMGELKKFIGSEDLKSTMQKAGVTGEPDIVYIEEFLKAPA